MIVVYRKKKETLNQSLCDDGLKINEFLKFFYILRAKNRPCNFIIVNQTNQ